MRNVLRLARTVSMLFGVLTVTAIAPWAIGGPSDFIAQADRGAAVYARHCAVCHGDHLQGAVAPALSGPVFAQQWTKGTRTAGDLYYIISTSMPRPATGSLTQDEYLGLVAYVLAHNDVAPGVDALTLDSLGHAVAGTGTAGRSPAAASNGRQDRQLFIAGDQGMVAHGAGPSATELGQAAQSSDWVYHNHDYRGTRFSPLEQINRQNVSRLQVACVYQFGALENFVTGPVVYRGTMFVTTPKLTVAIDAATCRERWRYQWPAQDAESWPNNRGVAIKDGYVVRGTSDGYLIALDAADGRLLWARQVARPAAGEAFSMPPLIFEDLILIAPAGSENSIQGWIGAFRLTDGAPVWRFNTIPRAGEPGFDTWIHDAKLPIGGGAVWSPMSLDVQRGQLYVPVTNPAPVFGADLRRGANLYTDSLVALDVHTGTLRWYAQLVPNDDKDWDVTQVSPIVEVAVDGHLHPVVVAGGKDGIVRLYDQDTHALLRQTAIGQHLNVDVPITAAGTRFCPGDLGGIQWNGPAWYPPLQTLYVPSVDWCTTGKLGDESLIVSGKDYMGGTDEMDPVAQAHGLLTAIDASTGSIRWQYHSEKPMVAGVTATAGGLIFTGENTGDVLAFDADDGRVLYRFNVGGAMTAGVVTYAVEGRQYIGVASGKGSFWFGEDKGAPAIFVFKLGAP